MQPQIKFRGINSLAGLASLIAEQLSELEREMLITDAQVVLTQQSETNPSARADVLLTMRD